MLNEVVENLENHPNRVRIKKLIFCACTKRWNNDVTILNSLSLTTLVKELLSIAPTINHLKYILSRVVERVTKPREYSFIAHIIIDEMEKLYSHDFMPKASIPDDYNGFEIKSLPNQQEKLVILDLDESNVEQGVRATLEILEANNQIQTWATSWLPSAPDIINKYADWQSQYHSLNLNSRLEASETKVSNISSSENSQQCAHSAEVLRNSLNNWYNSLEFSRIRERLLEELEEDAEIRIVIRTKSSRLWQLPWNLFFQPFLNRYPKAEVAISIPENNRISSESNITKKVKILVVLGRGTEIEVEKYRKNLEALPDSETVLLVEPTREQINNKISEQAWSILFFASNFSNHSETDRIYINKTESLTIWGLKYALTKAIVRGLKLAIFNLGDGLGLVRELASLQIPQLIVMREPVPERVSQEFLKLFLKAFSGGKSLHAAVREARERLQPLEDVFPGASWLPVICQNPTAVPLTWQECRLPIKKQNQEQHQERQAQESRDDSTLLLTRSEIRPQQLPPPPPPPPLRQTIFYKKISLADTLTGFSTEVYAVAISPDGQKLVSGSGDISHEDDTIKIWNLDNGTLINTLTGHLHWVYAIAISPDGKTIVSGSLDSTIKIWNLATGAPRPPEIDHYHGVNSVTISPDGERVVSGSDDSTIKIWNLGTGTLVSTLNGHSRAVISVAISPDGQRIVSGSDDSTIKIWNFSTATSISTLNGHEGSILSVAISPDGKTIVSGSNDKTIKIWNLAAGTLFGTLTGHEKSVVAVALSPDGKTIISGSLDKTIKIWNLATSTLLHTLTGHESPVLSLALSPDGKTIVSGSYGEIKIWRVSP
ncbi:MAG: CHAT domain-containing protein [Aphanothece sp. CMT-3BRIN-NPC111]|jgi:WD40 repeat protein|nr:CHAT domain-containing protein [Aphanothece sp. CMT-3BRIN-NPC111]